MFVAAEEEGRLCCGGRGSEVVTHVDVPVVTLRAAGATNTMGQRQRRCAITV